MDFRTRVPRDWVPRGVEEGVHEEGRQVRGGPLVHGGPSLMGYDEGEAWDPSGRDEGAMDLAPGMVA